MPIPKYDEMMLPLLRTLSDGHELHTKEAAKKIADHFRLSDEERAEKLPSGQSTYVSNRAGWANFSLRKAGLVEFVRPAIMRITSEGQRFLATNPDKITRTVLLQFAPFRAFVQQQSKAGEAAAATQRANVAGSAVGAPNPAETPENETTPEEAIERGYAELQASLAAELLAKVKASDPFFFEQLVVDLLLRMGYGGSRTEAGRATKPTGDGGIDGVIDEDRLGLDAIYVQAKRWENSVGEPQLRDFVGALHAHRARKGVFITTSEFTETARRYVERVDFKISLIDGRRLTELMMDFNVGVSLARSYEVKKLDNDYFAEG